MMRIANARTGKEYRGLKSIFDMASIHQEGIQGIAVKDSWISDTQARTLAHAEHYREALTSGSAE
jgi:hypothetical protein